ncbi:AbrB family transcriptional regulator [archaeon]|nr:AbrB family transcriptional regulator [archaeon]|tara:strand:+ start:2463 stop:2696 length:234 start_codon:yes stop_codon:yes gene_type:complete
MIEQMRTITITEKGQISIPKEMRKTKQFKTGAKLAIIAFKDHIELRPLKQLETALASEKSLAKHWLSKEDEKAWKNL